MMKHVQLALLAAAGVARVERLLPADQGLRGETGAGVLHGDGHLVPCAGCAQGDLPARRRIADCVVQQIAHRPIQAGAVHGQRGLGGGGAVEPDLLCGAETLPDPPPPADQVLQGRRLLSVRLRPLGRHGPQLRHVRLEPQGAVQDGLHHLPLGWRQFVLGQQFRVAADHGEGGLQVMGQRCQLQAALLLQRPLPLQGLGQAQAHLLHGVQGLPELPHLGLPGQGRVQALLGDGLRRAGQQGGVPPQEAGKVPGGDGPRRQPGEQQDDGRTGLKLRQAALEDLNAVGHGVVVLDHAGGPVRHLDQPVVLGIEPPLRVPLPGKGGLGVVQVLRVHIARVLHLPALVKEGPAVIVGDLRCVQLPGGEGPGHRPHPALGGVGRVHDAMPHQGDQPDPPEDGQQQDRRAGREQIPPEYGRQAGGPL